MTGVITYLYWGLLFVLAVAALVFVGFKMRHWKAAFITVILILISGLIIYFFHFRQIFVKQYGGIMSVDVPSGQHHMGTSWKNDNLWIENYDPATNTCYFREYSQGHLLQGEVSLTNCNPLMPTQLQTN